MLSEREISLLQTSWGRVNHSDIAVDIYNRLFYLNPATRLLFKENVGAQAQILVNKITYIIENLNNWESLKLELRELGERHILYGTVPAHYQQLLASLEFGLRAHLKSEFTTELGQVWVKFYWILVDAMCGAD